MFNIWAKFFEHANKRKIKAMQATVDSINSFEPVISKLSDQELKDKTVYFRGLLSKGKTIDDILPEAFAVVREAAKRTTGMRPFDVQLIGAIVLHQGKISEMKTGEGKTLVATLPAYLNALTGKGVFIVTVNDYLARRDREWMGQIYEFLDLTVGVIQSHMDPLLRQQAYACDITYGTNNEFGFDYLRDNMAMHIQECVQRNLHYAIVDEVDSILIDEARTPLIISGMLEDNTDRFKRLGQLAKRLTEKVDYTVDEKQKHVVLTETGIERIEKELNMDSLYDITNMDTAHMIVQCVKAYKLFKKDVDYVIKDGEIVIVDEFTGRLMIGRRYSDGLHQAIEAVENVAIRAESQTLATITFQNYFRMFDKLAGMTGTAVTEEAEFAKIYGLEVLEIPTNEPMVRIDSPDVIYKNKRAKYKAIVEDVVQLHKKGIPVLVGTIAIETSELLSEMLGRKGVQHCVLNAKFHEKEAEIIVKAGQHGAVTIATNMAGRGTDIKLGEGVVALGGLHIIGTERHESRRIDNQLRGRAGRQGDPGFSKFYVSLEDDLMRLFGSHRIASVMEAMGITEDTPIEHRMISNAIERAQKKVEAHNFEIRKQVLKFDNVMNKQRDSFYRWRRSILVGKEIKQKIVDLITSIITDYVNMFVPEKSKDPFNREELIDALQKVFPLDRIKEIVTQQDNRAPMIATLTGLASAYYADKENTLGPDIMRELEKAVMLRITDTKWIEHLNNMDALRDGIGLRAYGQKDPLIEYQIEGFTMFREMMANIEEETISLLFRVQPVVEPYNPTPVARNVSYHGGGGDAPASHQSVRKDDKVGRNDPCPCGSGKKYKKCCGQDK